MYAYRNTRYKIMFGEISGSQGNEYEDHHLQDGSSSYKPKR